MRLEPKDPHLIPDWVDREAARRLAKMHDPAFGLSHEEVGKRIERRNRPSLREDTTELNQ